MAVKSLKASGVVNHQKSNSMLAGYSFNDFELIESVFLASNAASVTFSNLNQYATEYTHLQIRAVCRSTTTDSIQSANGIIFNGVQTGGPYNSHRLFGDGSTVFSEGFTNTNQGFSNIGVGNGAAANIFGPYVADILDAFSTTKFKTVRVLYGAQTNVLSRVGLNSFAYRSTDTISSVGIVPRDGFSWVSGSRFSLYGIR
jgi:hypothetical protein